MVTPGDTPACVRFNELFLHPYLEDPASATTASQRARQRVLMNRGQKLCEACPLLEQCRYDAVARYDVTGFVAGTTARERSKMRRLLGHKVTRENLDTAAGVPARRRQVSSEEVVRLRQTNPHESLSQIAQRLGCSVSTVKRHLSKSRAAAVERTEPLEDDKVQLPTPDQVSRSAILVRARRGRYHAA